MKTLRLFVYSLFALAALSCQPNENKPAPDNGNENQTGTEITEERHPDMDEFEFEYTEGFILNPERGLYKPKEFRGVGNPLTATEAKNIRKNGYTLMLLEFYLGKYLESDIAPEYLAMVEESFKALREGGIKCILRFAYTSDQNASVYDPEEPQLMAHIAQLKPLFQAYGDVIAVLQAGFVGCWGEWYYTTHYVQGPSKKEDYEPRGRVLKALLDAMPTNREVSVRTPDFKKHIFELKLKDSLTVATAHNGSDLSRVSGHNDCFGASSSDYGTFSDYESRKLWKTETRYGFMGGETCAVSNYCECKVSLKDCKDYHWTYLNQDYNRNVHQVWKDGDCYDEIVDHLGYRLCMKKLWLSRNPRPGDLLDIFMRIENTGYAAPVNPRGAELIFVDGTGIKTVYPLDSDPRFWFEGTVTAVDTRIELPADARGRCTLYLNLPDGDSKLSGDPRYSIRLANDDVWNANTGYNKIAEIVL